MKDIKQDITDKIIDALENNIVPWRSPFAFPMNFHSRHRYSGINVLILWLEMMQKGYTSHYWLTFKQTKELKGSVRKGESGCPIIFYKLLEKKETNSNGETEVKCIPIIKYYYVFNLSQVEDVDIDTNNEDIKDIPDFRMLLDNCGAVIKHHGEKAFYSNTDDFINLPFKSKFHSNEDYYSTLAHELVHWSGNKSRLDRLDIKTSQELAFEELIAEIGSGFLLSEYNLKTDIDNTAAYVRSWLELLKNDKNCIFSAAKKANEAVEYLNNFIRKEEQVCA